jgi:hypothetical protein
MLVIFSERKFVKLPFHIIVIQDQTVLIMLVVKIQQSVQFLSR